MIAVPGELTALRTRVQDALIELRSIRCADPAATEAMDTVKLTERTLTEWWAPTLDALLHD